MHTRNDIVRWLEDRGGDYNQPEAERLRFVDALALVKAQQTASSNALPAAAEPFGYVSARNCDPHGGDFVRVPNPAFSVPIYRAAPSQPVALIDAVKLEEQPT